MNPLMIDEGMPTELAQAVSLFSKRAEIEEVWAEKAISIRMPWNVYVCVKALSEHSGMSLNRTLNQLLRVAVDVVGEALPEEDAHEVELLRSKALTDLINEQEV